MHKFNGKCTLCGCFMYSFPYCAPLQNAGLLGTLHTLTAGFWFPQTAAFIPTKKIKANTYPRRCHSLPVVKSYHPPDTHKPAPLDEIAPRRHNSAPVAFPAHLPAKKTHTKPLPMRRAYHVIYRPCVRSNPLLSNATVATLIYAHMTRAAPWKFRRIPLQAG